MKKYAEMLAYLGVMSNKVPTSVSEQQKILPKMAMLISNDRFKYLNGFVPRKLMMDIVFSRIEFATLSDSEKALVKQRIEAYITSKYKTDKEDDVQLPLRLTISEATPTFPHSARTFTASAPAA